MKKTISFGKVDYRENGKKDCEVTIEIELKQSKAGKRIFSASANIWNPKKTDIYTGGQCLDSIFSEFADQIENRELYAEIIGLWEKHHLNDMNAGTPLQTQAVEAWLKQGNKYEYSAVCEYLKSIDLYEDQIPVEGEPKTTLPYRYGSAWLYREIPEADLKRIEAIISA